jgi:hypothetical protein
MTLLTLKLHIPEIFLYTKNKLTFNALIDYKYLFLHPITKKQNET